MLTSALTLLLAASAFITHAQNSEIPPAMPMPTIEEDEPKPAAPPKPVAPPGTPAPLEGIALKAKNFCNSVEKCNKRPGRSAYCVKMGLKESGMLGYMLEGEQAKDLARFLRKAGFSDQEQDVTDFKYVPEGSILVLDSHDLKDKRPACPKVYGNVLIKCGEKWIDEQKNELDFHMKRGCRTKGIWLHPDLKLIDPPAGKNLRKRLITDPPDSP
ncbi:MAG: hypothetical protein KF799_02065 [Bdellovibrionales bacterium]|nr:hypothetical protein [Bdellovibrionales bacterium]